MIPIIINDASGNKLKLSELSHMIGISKSTLLRRYHKHKCRTLKSFVLLSAREDRGNKISFKGRIYNTILGKMYFGEIKEFSECNANTVAGRIKAHGEGSIAIFLSQNHSTYIKQCKVHGVKIYINRGRRYKSELKDFDKISFCCKGNIINYKCLNYSGCSDIWALCGQHHDRYKSDGSCYKMPTVRRTFTI